ncbi:hypothetical protein Tco_0332883 [Tanacetum coccineum]
MRQTPHANKLLPINMSRIPNQAFITKGQLMGIERTTTKDWKAKSFPESGFTSPNPFDFLTKEDGKSILQGSKRRAMAAESDNDVDVENGYDEMAAFVVYKSLGNYMGKTRNV